MTTVKRLPHHQKKVFGKKSRLRESINAVLRKHNGKTAISNRTAGYATQRARSDMLHQGFNYLFDEGYKLTDVKGFGQRHMKVLVEHWIEKDLMPSTIQNKFSTFRIFCEWIGKKGMIFNLDRYTDDASIYKVGTVSDFDKSWTTHGVDPRKKIDEICEHSPLIAYQLELMWAFGLRPKESWLLRATIVSGGASLHVSHGTKGGRDRFVPIESEDQRSLLSDHPYYANKVNGSLIPSGMPLKKWKSHFYGVMAKYGLVKDKESGEGVTAYGLRHEYANTVFETFTGSESVVRAKTRGNQIDEIAKDIEDKALYEVSSRLGHGRTQITGMYTGTKSSSPAAKKAREAFIQKAGHRHKDPK